MEGRLEPRGIWEGIPQEAPSEKVSPHWKEPDMGQSGKNIAGRRNRKCRGFEVGGCVEAVQKPGEARR